MGNETTIGRVGIEILLSLAGRELHGYGIKLDVEERTRGDVVLRSGSLYEAIQRLEQAGLIKGKRPASSKPATTRTRRYYRITAAGRRALEAELDRLEQLVAFGRAQLDEA